MDTWLKNELPEEWPENNTTSNSDNTVQSTRSHHQLSSSTQSSTQSATNMGQTVAIQLQPENKQEAQWKAALSPSKPNMDHLQGLFNIQQGSEFPIQDTSASESDLSSVAEQTRRLKLFTETKNTYTNQRLDALATSLQGHQSEDEKSDIVRNLMNDGNNALSRIRKASNLELRAVYENENETSNEASVIKLNTHHNVDSSLDDLSHLDHSNGSTLSSLTDHNATVHSTHTTRPAKSIESLNNPTVRFKTPTQTPARSQFREPEVPSLAIPESSFDLEEKPFMSFVDNEYGHNAPLTTSASDSSGTAIRPPARQVRRETVVHSRPPSSVVRGADPRPKADQTQVSNQAPSVPSVPRQDPSQMAHQMPGTVRFRPSRGSTWGSLKSDIMSQRLNTSVETSIDRVFDVSMVLNTAPLRDLSMPNIDEDNLSIARKNLSFSGSLFDIVQRVRSADNSNVDFEIDLSTTQLECLKGLDDLLPHLTRANLAENCIQVVEGLPQSLIELDLSHNSLNRLTSFPLMFLTTLNVSHNNLEDLTSLSQLRALSHLDISNNSLKSLKGIDALYSLETLNVGENSLKSLKITHPKLRNLRAANNNIEALDLNTPALEVLNLNNNSILSFEPLPSVRKLSICNNGAKLNFSHWDSLEELYYDGNSSALELGRVNPLVVSWTCTGTTQGFDPNALVSCQVLSINKKSTLKLLSGVSALPVQQLNLSGMGLKSLPVWLPTCFPRLRCLNLAFNQLDDNSLRVISEFKELRILGLFGNSVSSFASLTLSLRQLGHLGALDLRGNPVTNDLYPDMKTLLMDTSNGSPGEQYDRLLGMDWNTVLDEWQREPSIPQKFHDYGDKLSDLKLWWLDGAVVNDTPRSSRVWTNPRASGLGAIRVEGARQKLDLDTHDDQSSYNSTEVSANDESSYLEVPPAQPATSSPASPCGEYDMRFKFQTPSQHNLFTPSRVTGEISTIGKAKRAQAVHSTPGPIGIPESDILTPRTTSKPYSSRPLAKSMSRTRKPLEEMVGFENKQTQTSMSTLTMANKVNAELTADFIVSLYKRQYAAMK